MQTEPNPDLYYNRATIYEYLERYNEAVRDYNIAHKIDPELLAEAKAHKIIDFVARASSLISAKGQMKSKKMTEIVKSVPTTLESEIKFALNEE